MKVEKLNHPKTETPQLPEIGFAIYNQTVHSKPQGLDLFADIKSQSPITKWVEVDMFRWVIGMDETHFSSSRRPRIFASMCVWERERERERGEEEKKSPRMKKKKKLKIKKIIFFIFVLSIFQLIFQFFFS